jgi:hypothetical protein
MSLVIADKKIKGSFDFFSDFFKAVDTSIADKGIVYISVEDNTLSMYSEDKIDGISAGVSVSLNTKVPAACEPFYFGVDAERVVAFFKKLYPGEVTITLKNNKKGNTVEFKEDNIKASFVVVAKKRRIRLPELNRIEGDSCQWIVEGVGDCLSAISETSKKGSVNKFAGILVDTKGGVSRICKFSQISFYLKTGNALFTGDSRFILPDTLAKVCRSFKKSVKSIVLSSSTNIAGVELTNGTLITLPVPHDSYPLEYASHFSLTNNSRLQELRECYKLDASALASAVDLVTSSLGPTDSWITFKILGQSGDSLVWEISGKSHKGVEVSEKILSSHGKVVEGFMLNKERLSKALNLFKDEIYLCDLNSSVAAFTDAEGYRVSLLVKAAI